MANQSNIFPSIELYPDPYYDENAGKSWWDLHWKKAIQWIVFGAVYLTSVVLMCFPATQAFGIKMFTEGIIGAISGFVIGGVIGGLVSAKQGNSFFDGLLEGSVYGLINGFTTSAILFCGSEAISAIRKPSCCFIAGTVVLTEEGNKAIEDIVVGDMVWSYNEETGQKDLKRVVRLFRNETEEWIHINIYKTNEETCEEIVCTPEHPFYIPNIGWVNASNLVENMEILLYNGTKVNIAKIKREVLETPETTYNFEVEDYHTYYVGIEGILVHNFCEKEFSDYYVKYNGEGQTFKAYHQASGPHKGLFVARDGFGHGGASMGNKGSSFKLLKEVSGSKLKLIADLNSEGVIMIGKHSSNIGELYKYFGGFRL